MHFHHPQMWKREGGFKDYAASYLALQIRDNKALIRQLLILKCRTLSMLVYRAIELLNSDADIEALSEQV